MILANWHLVACGINYKTSSLEQREKLQIGHDKIAEAHGIFSGLPGIMEATIVSTCNRVEFYFTADKFQDPLDNIQAFYQEFKNLDISGLRTNFYCKKNKEAAEQLFRVAAGLDSMVLGENQIQGQIKDAYKSSCAVKVAGKVIHRLFHQAFRVGKQVRTDTEMGLGNCSVSSVAVEFLKTRIEQMERPTILFIGINQMIALAAMNLSKLNCGPFYFVNRTPEKALTFAAQYKRASGYGLEQLAVLLKQTDIVISCTGSPHPVVTTPMMDNVLALDPGKNLLFMDMAIPRDIEIDKDYHANLEICDLEDIKKFVAVQKKRREQAIPQAEKIIESKLAEFNYWFDHVRHDPIYNGLNKSFEVVRRKELAPILKKLPPDLQEELNQTTRHLVNRLLQMKIRTSSMKSS